MKLKSKLQKRFELLVNDYVIAFERKHDTALEFWVADDVGGIGVFSDCYFDFCNIRTDVDSKANKKMIWQWYEESLEAGVGNGTNYPSFLMGLRVKDINKEKKECSANTP